MHSGMDVIMVVHGCTKNQMHSHMDVIMVLARMHLLMSVLLMAWAQVEWDALAHGCHYDLVQCHPEYHKTQAHRVCETPTACRRWAPSQSAIPSPTSHVEKLPRDLSRSSPSSPHDGVLRHAKTITLRGRTAQLKFLVALPI